MTSIRYIAPARGGWSHHAGSFAQATRGYVHALDAAGYSVWLDSLCKEDSELYRMAQTQGPEVKAVERFATKIEKPEVLICSAFATELPDLGALRREHSYQACILQTTFETTNPAKSVVAAMKRWDAVFVPSTWNRDCLLDAGLEHVYAIPHVIPPEWHDLLTLPPPKSPAFTFGVVGTWEPRKASDLVVRAFAQAFEPGEAKLILKCGQIDWHPYLTPQQCVAKYAPGHGIEIRDKILSRAELLKLYGEIDVLVSASHGEGFCLPVLEAKIAGRRVVCTDSGGPRDIVTSDDLLVPGRTEVCAWSDVYGWPAGSMWHSHDLGDLVTALRRAKEMGPPRRYRRGMLDWNAKDLANELAPWPKSLREDEHKHRAQVAIETTLEVDAELLSRLADDLVDEDALAGFYKFSPDAVGAQMRDMIEATLKRNEAVARARGVEWPP